jgi:tetratricopeptide (TPR) repeat protein
MPVPEEPVVMPPAPTPPQVVAEPPAPAKRTGIFEGRSWLKWAIPAGLIVTFLCLITAAAVIGPIIFNGTDPTETVVVDPKTAAEHVEQGYQFYDAGNYEDAVVEFEAAIARGSEDVDMHFELADAYNELNRLDDAMRTIKNATLIAPDDPYVFETAGWFFQYFEMHEDAIQKFERALELDPSAEYLYLDMATSYDALGDFDKASELRGMSGSDQKEEDAIAVETQAWDEYFAGDYQAAFDSFSRAVELDPYLLSAWGGLSDSYWYLGDTNSAIFTLESALEINQPEAWVYEKLGWFYWDLSDSETAIGFYEQAIEMDPEWTTAYSSLSDLHYDRGNLELALASLERGITANPDRTDFLEEIGYLYIEVGDMNNAIESFQRATEIDPFYGWNHYGLAYAYYGAGNYDAAGAALESAAANSFEDPWLEDSIGWMYISLERCDLAIPHFEIALELDPSMTDSQDGIEYCGG